MLQFFSVIFDGLGDVFTEKLLVVKVESMSNNRPPHDLMIATKLNSTPLQCKGVSDLEAYMNYFLLPGKERCEIFSHQYVSKDK